MLKFRKYLLFLSVPTFVLGMILAALISTPSKSKTIAYRETLRSGGATNGGSIPLRIYSAEASNASAPAATPTPTVVPTPTPAEVKAAANTARIIPAPTPRPVVKPRATAPAPPAPSAATCSGGMSAQFICLLNQYRASKGLGKLSANSGLAGVALTHSQWMQTTGTFSHTGENGSKFFDRCALAKITCRAENLAVGVGTAENLLKMWKESAGHNANLLGPYSTIGIGIAGSYVTALFN